MSIWKKYGRWRDGWVFSIILGSILVFVTVLIVAIMYGPVRWSCRNTAEQMGLEWQFSFTTQCMVQTPDGNWVPLDAWRVQEDSGR